MEPFIACCSVWAKALCWRPSIPWPIMVYFYKLLFWWRVVSLALIPHLPISIFNMIFKSKNKVKIWILFWTFPIAHKQVCWMTKHKLTYGTIQYIISLCAKFFRKSRLCLILFFLHFKCVQFLQLNTQWNMCTKFDFDFTFNHSAFRKDSLFLSSIFFFVDSYFKIRSFFSAVLFHQVE